MSSTVPWLMLPLPPSSSTENPAMAELTVPSVVAMPSHARKVRSLATGGRGGGAAWVLGYGTGRTHRAPAVPTAL